MSVSPKLLEWLKGLLAEVFILTCAVVGVLVLLRTGGGHIELTIALWAFVALAVVTVANVALKHRLWILPFVASLVALVAPLACLERLREPSQAAGEVPGAAVPLMTVIVVALAAAACMIGSLISGRLSGR